MIKIDKIDSSAIRCPTQWKLLNTAFFRDGNRVEVGLIGSWWSGLRQSVPIHFRTIFDDLAETGSSMQFSTLLLNLHEKVLAENPFPADVTEQLREWTQAMLACRGSPVVTSPDDQTQLIRVRLLQALLKDAGDPDHAVMSQYARGVRVGVALLRTAQHQPQRHFPTTSAPTYS